jgi:hypothetical protein
LAAECFFVLAYALAKGTLGILSLAAQQSGVDSVVTFMQMGKTLEFDEAWGI